MEDNNQLTKQDLLQALLNFKTELKAELKAELGEEFRAANSAMEARLDLRIDIFKDEYIKYIKETKDDLIKSLSTHIEDFEKYLLDRLKVTEVRFPEIRSVKIRMENLEKKVKDIEEKLSA